MLFQKTVFYLLFIFSLIGQNSFAQKLKFGELGIPEGLPSTEVYNLFQDKKGYIWVFTEYGIVKHNGTEFIEVCKNISLEESAVYAVTDNTKGEMYFVNSKANIYKIKNDKAYLVPGSKEISDLVLSKNQVVPNLFVSDSQDIYFSTLDKSYLLKSGQKKITDLSEKYGKEYSGICYKKIQDNYTLIKLKTDNHSKKIHLLNKEQSISYPLSEKTIIGQERNFIRKRKNGFYILMANELVFINNHGKIKKTYFTTPTINLEISNDGRVWVGVMNGGLYELDQNLKVKNHYLDELSVSDILFDSQSGMWITTTERGMYYCKNIYDEYYENIPQLSGNISLIKKAKDALFIGTTTGNLFVKRKGKLRQIQFKNGCGYITDVTYYNNNYLIGTKFGIWKLDNNFNDQGNLNCQYLNCYGFSDDKNGSLHFISSVSINTYDLTRITSRHFLTCKPRSIVQTSKNELIVGTNLGLYTFKDKLYSPDYFKELKNVRITKLKSDSNKNSWICTRGHGLYKLTPSNKLIKYNNTPSEVINDISFIHHGIVLLSTNKGLFINYTGDLNNKSAWILILDDEIISAEEYANFIYIGTKRGLISFNGKYLFKNDYSKFYLESITVNRKKRQLNSIHLNHTENDLYFNFDFLAYQFPDKKLFYKLYGNSSIKGIVNGTQIHLQNLNPGNYTLVVHPLIPLNSKRTFKISFSIKPAFWQTKLFFFSVLLFSILFIFAIITLLIKRVKKKEERKAEINALLSEYKLIALKAQINPHFISNSLAAIQHLIATNEVDLANQYLAKFSLLIRYVLVYSDKSAVQLKNELEIIDLNVDLEQLRFGTNFQYEKVISPTIIESGIYIPPLITQPFIENAIWHGLLPLKNKRSPKLIVKVDFMDDHVTISIIDNGVGRSNDEQKIENGLKRESKGISIIKSRMETLNELYATTGATIHFIDLKNEQNEPIGTQVNIVFPILILTKLYDDKDKKRHY